MRANKTTNVAVHCLPKCGLRSPYYIDDVDAHDHAHNHRNNHGNDYRNHVRAYPAPNISVANHTTDPAPNCPSDPGPDPVSNLGADPGPNPGPVSGTDHGTDIDADIGTHHRTNEHATHAVSDPSLPAELWRRGLQPRWEVSWLQREPAPPPRQVSAEHFLQAPQGAERELGRRNLPLRHRALPLLHPEPRW